MRKLKLNLATALALIAMPALTSCGSSNSSNPATTSYQTECTTNAYGQQTCTQVAIGSGGCISLSSGLGSVTLSFYGSGNLDSGYSVEAGQIPGGISAGSLVLTQGTTGYTTGGYAYTGYSDAGTVLSLSGPQSGTSLSGSLTLDSLMIQSIIQDSGTGYGGYSGSYGSSVCVSAIAIQGSYYQSVAGFTGNVYLYLNNTSHGYVVPIY